VRTHGRLDIYNAQIRSEHAWFAEAPTVTRYVLNSFRQGVWKTDMALYWEMFRQSGFGFVGIFQKMASGNTLLRNKGDGTFENRALVSGVAFGQNGDATSAMVRPTDMIRLSQ